MVLPPIRSWARDKDNPLSRHPNPSSSIVTGRGKHVEGVYKVPDAGFGYMDRRPDAVSITAGCPRVVFKVPVSQSYESALGDARQLLVRSKGRVVLCIVIKIHEESKRCLGGIRSGLGKGHPVEEHPVDERPVHDAPEAASTAAASSSDDDGMDSNSTHILYQISQYRSNSPHTSD